MRHLFIALALALVAPVALADDPYSVAPMLERRTDVSALENYRANVAYSNTICSLVRLGGISPAGCIAAHKLILTRLYQAAIKSVRKAPAVAALKEHFVQAVALVDGIEPGIGEIAIDYDRRQVANQEKLKRAWTRVEVEL